MLSINWGLYIWSISINNLLASSLGYFLAPLFYLLVGRIFLKEKISKLKTIALAIASLGLVPLVSYSDLNTFLIACGLALSIVAYACIRKGSQLSSFHALTIESVCVLPFALFYIFQGAATIPESSQNWRIYLLLLGTGPVTLLPLLFFGYAVKSLELNQIGFLQYISPVLQFTLALLVFSEPLDNLRLSSFALVWIGILVYLASFRCDPNPGK